MDNGQKYQGVYSVVGPPGTGKTTFLGSQTEACAEAGETVVVASYTRAAAHEISGRNLSIDQERVNTLHGHAYRSIGRPPVAEQVIGKWNEENPTLKITGSFDPDDPDGSKKGERGDTWLARYDLLRAEMVDKKIWSEDLLDFAKLWERWKEQHGVVDFGDMIERAIDAPFPPHGATVIIVDESQDLSPIELKLVRSWGSQTKAVIYAGDPYQSIYRWRGASPTGFDNPSEADKRKILHQSYRVPRAVHDISMRWATQLTDYDSTIKYTPRDDDGVVETIGGRYGDPGQIVEKLIEAADEGRTAMVCGACSYMLAKTIAKMRVEGVPYSNPWRRKRGDWNPLGPRRGRTSSDRLCSFLRPLSTDGKWGGHLSFDPSQAQMSWNLGHVADFVGMLRATGTLVRGAASQIKEDAVNRPRAPMEEREHLARYFLPENLDFMEAMANADKTIFEALEWISERFNSSMGRQKGYLMEVAKKRGVQALSEKPRVHIGTIHSFKGSEAQRVIILPDLPARAYTRWRAGGEAKDDVVRQFYVGMTRAKEELFICRPDSVHHCSIGMEVNG